MQVAGNICWVEPSTEAKNVGLEWKEIGVKRAGTPSPRRMGWISGVCLEMESSHFGTLCWSLQDKDFITCPGLCMFACFEGSHS